MTSAQVHGRPTAFANVRIVDPASGYDGPGGLIVTEGVIADVVRGPDLGALSPDVEVIDGQGALLLPGLVDIRVKTGEPGA
jgi:dihydroorotase